MADVNLLNYGWSYSKDSNVVLTIDTSSEEADTQVKFEVASGDGQGRSKAYITVNDISKYSALYFEYERISQYGNTALLFGIFDDTDRNSKNGIILIGDGSGDFLSWSKNDADEGGYCRVDIPSDLSGRKYIGFRFWANGDTHGKCKESIYINDLFLEERGYTLTYDANGGSGAPNSVSDITSTTISSTKPTRSGYEFLGWSTSSSATSASYVAGNSITLSSNITLYAVWRKYCTITYNANGGSGTTSSQTGAANTTVSLRSNGFTAPESAVWTLTLDGNGGKNGTPTFKGNYFNKWRTGATSGTSYSAGDSYILSKDVTLYAWWGSKYVWGTTTRDNDSSEGYMVTFDANGGSCDTSFMTSEIITSYDFLGWGNAATDPTTTYKSTSTYQQTNNYTAYAIWSPTTTDGSIILPTPTRDNYDFLGWSTDQYDESGIIGEYTPTEDVTLYAIWKIKGQVYICDKLDGCSPYKVLIRDSSGCNQYVPLIRTYSGWEPYTG